MYQSQRQILGNIKVLLAGRVAEELTFGADEITTGASNDIQKASSLIVDYVNKFGMDPDIGLFSTEVIGDGLDHELIEKCRNIINSLYEEVKKLLEDNISALNNVADELLIKESLSDEDITRHVA